jgi:hypothetical protein
MPEESIHNHNTPPVTSKDPSILPRIHFGMRVDASQGLAIA